MEVTVVRKDSTHLVIEDASQTAYSVGLTDLMETGYFVYEDNTCSFAVPEAEISYIFAKKP